MGIVSAITVSTRAFDLGVALREASIDATLESFLLFGTTAIAICCVSAGQTHFMNRLRSFGDVSQIQLIGRVEDAEVFSLDLDVIDEPFFSAIDENDATVLDATGDMDTWTFYVQFPTPDAFDDVLSVVEEQRLPVDVEELYTETNPAAGPEFGLTSAQHDTIRTAVSRGYYDIPRNVTTQDLATEFGISDQAVTERLRRAIENVANNTILYGDE